MIETIVIVVCVSATIAYFRDEIGDMLVGITDLLNAKTKEIKSRADERMLKNCKVNNPVGNPVELEVENLCVMSDGTIRPMTVSGCVPEKQDPTISE